MTSISPTATSLKWNLPGATAIQRDELARVKRENDVKMTDIESQLAALHRQSDPLLKTVTDKNHHNTLVDKWTTFGTLAGMATVVGGVIGLATTKGKDRAAMTAYGLAAGAVVGSLLGLVASNGITYRPPQGVALSPELQRLVDQEADLVTAKTATAQQRSYIIDRITPGKIDYGYHLTQGTTADWITENVAAFDHDGDGKLNVAAGQSLPGDETRRYAGGGPLENEREQAVTLLDSVPAFDVDHNGSVSPEEANRGLIRAEASVDAS